MIATERHSSRRIDRQLLGRAARQGDPGSYEEILCLEDEIVKQHGRAPLRALARLPLGLRRLLMVLAQKRAGRASRELRETLSRYESHMEQSLGFAGARQ